MWWKQEERMEEALKSRQNVFEQDVIGCLNEIKVRTAGLTLSYMAIISPNTRKWEMVRLML